ncbi:membrane protein insertase YidC [Hydrogenophaga sp. 5NK40-0174]|uniref:membrane protein insertase YidC n=1 Tax=Hydrogenophaga sp. 5NK40-0174 TaxID=3127649 RepID=UPI003106FAED
MNDIRRSILWVVFGLSMILLWDKWQVHNGKQATFFPTAQTAAQSEANAAANAPTIGGEVPKAATSSDVPVAAASAGAANASDVPGTPAVPVPAGEMVEITTDLYKLTFNTEGGSLVGADLLKHQRSADNSAPFELLRQNGEHIYVAQTGLVGASGLPTHKTPMLMVSSERALADGQDELKVVFETVQTDGVKLVKTYTLRRGHYDIKVDHKVINQGSSAVTPQLYVQLVRDGSEPESDTPFYKTFTGPALYSEEGKYQKVSFEDIREKDTKFEAKASDGYVAMVQHYFASAWILGQGVSRERFARQIGGNLYSAGALTTLPAIEPGQSESISATLFVGPQEEKVLESLTPGLELVKDYGWLAMLAKPLYWLLEKVHSFVGNWGWSIVLLVVLIKAAFYWLNANAYRSMAKMKAINPRIQEMRERLKDKPQLMQQEMMKMYRDEKVNPLGGCLPILVQMPVFIALYWVLLATVEMRNAPWIGWVTDLSTPDALFGVIPGINLPIGPLPIVMALTTVFQTALNPLPPDPLQAKMMWLMPIMFSVMFFFFPSGLVLYWITNNVLTIAQQAFINHKMGVPVKFNLPKFS